MNQTMCAQKYQVSLPSLKTSVEMSFTKSGPATPGGEGRGGMASPLFCIAKRKKGDKGKKDRISKQILLKGMVKILLSPRSKYYCFSHSRASRIRKFFLSANHVGLQYISVFYGPPL